MVHPETDEQVRFTGAPAPCVEVLSTNRGDDLVQKPMRYARAGLPHYWVIDPRDGDLSAYDLTRDGVYQRASTSLSIGPVDVTVDLAALLAP